MEKYWEWRLFMYIPESRVNPELRELLPTMPQEKFSREDLPEIRSVSEKAFSQMRPAGGKGDCSVYNRMIPGPEGAPDVRVRIYEPAQKGQDRPGLLYIHGGGYVIGSPEMTEMPCIQFVAELNCVVVSVDYRLAPENPFPAPLEDCYAALKWFSENAAELGVDAGRIAVTGSSAGGGLTATLALLARDRKGPPIVLQLPLCPMIDERNITPSSREFTDPRVWSREKNIFGWKMYLGDMCGEEVSPYAAAVHATDLSGLPPAYIYVGELDALRDETIEYVERLLQAGVPTEFHIYPGCFHSFEMAGQAEVSRRAKAELIGALRRALKKQ
jgi:acetyl esterase/lipase